MKDRIKILVIDDDLEMRQALQDFLQRNDYEVHVAKDVTEALVQLWKGRYHLAIADIVMPGLSGLKLLSIVRTVPVPVNFIVMTGNDSPENREEANRLGADGYIVKPFSLEELLSMIEDVMKDLSNQEIS